MTHAATRWLVPLGAAALLLPIARDANACSPWDPALDRTFPAQGDILPAGALLLLDGQVLSPDHLSVTVDGEPAALVLVHERSRGLYYWLWESAYRTMALRIEPPPQPAQTIVVTGDPCLEWEGMSFCDPVELIYSVGEADTEPPDAPVELWYDVYDHGEVASDGSLCGATTAQLEFTIWTEIGRERLEYPLEYRLSRRPRDLPGAWDVVEHDWLRDAKAFDPQFRWQYLIQAVQGLLPLAEALCLRLQTFDASGNLGGEIEVCPPCHDQFAGSTGVFAWPDGFPSYDDAWLYPGGYCPAKLEPDDTTGTTGTTGTTDTAGASTTSGADLDPTTKEATITGGSDPPVDQPEDGCACTASATSPGSPALGLLLGLLLLRSRRLAATASIERVTARCGGAGSHAS